VGPDPGASRRILISDQFYCCADSVGGNMTEAALHWLEYLGASDRDNRRLADAVKMGPGGPVISPPRPRNALDQLCQESIRIHQAGIIRALAFAGSDPRKLAHEGRAVDKEHRLLPHFLSAKTRNRIPFARQ
jgi:hypothetical protein